jgi:hypothetical protein
MMNGVAMPRSNTKRRSSKPATTVITHVAAHDLRVNGSSVSRPDLRDAVVLANRVYVSGLAAEIDRWREEGWVNPRFSSIELAEWWAVQVHGRCFVEVDIEDRELSEWVNITLFSVRHILGLSE